MEPTLTTPKPPPPPCPFLPDAPPAMSWRDLRNAPNAVQRFTAATTYAQFLWLQRLPARSILALCRALYLDPTSLPPAFEQPFPAYSWILAHHDNTGFLGNPRLSFFHQATRTHARRHLQRQRACALWYLTCRIFPHLPADPREAEWNPPAIASLTDFLNQHGLPHEGTAFQQTLQSAPVRDSPSPQQNQPFLHSGPRPARIPLSRLL